MVEKGLVGAEQSSRNWGWCRQQGRDFGEVPLIRHSVAMWANMAAEIGADVGWRNTGVLFVSDDPREIAELGSLVRLRPRPPDSQPVAEVRPKLRR